MLTPVPIIIINWNGIDDTLECIDSVLKQDFTDFQIHLIDNDSDNDEGIRLAEQFKGSNKITVYQNEDNLGFAIGHNRWYEQYSPEYKSPYIVLLNNDTSVEPNWLNELISCAKKNQADIIASKMIDYYDRSKMDNAGHKMINTGEILPIGHGEPIEKYDEEFENIGACAGACLYTTKLIDHLGFFDPYFSTGYEDAEFGLRAVIANYKSIYCPKAIVYHKMGQSIKKIFDSKYALMIQTSILYTYFKLMPTFKIFTDIPSFIFKFISMLIIDLVFWRPKYLKILIDSWKNLWNIRSLVGMKRKIYYSKLEESIRIGSLFKKIQFFLWFDLKRFWKLIISNNNSSIDQYR